MTVLAVKVKSGKKLRRPPLDFPPYKHCGQCGGSGYKGKSGKKPCDCTLHRNNIYLLGLEDAYRED